MGLASAMSTALTGMSAAETQIDVTGNNIANAQTVGFKASEAQFATQFLQTQSLGSKPTNTNGGTNPRQTGLGTKVAEITPNFTQGTIEISSNESDLAIQGDGFFIVEGGGGEKLFTRNGIFKTNSQNELVTITGQRVLGFGIDDSFQIQRTQLVPLSIPVGAKSVAKSTENVFLEGTLTSSGDVADTAQVSESVILGNSAIPRPDSSGSSASVASLPDNSATTLVNEIEPGVGSVVPSAVDPDGAGGLAENTLYTYRVTFSDAAFANETQASNAFSFTTPVSDGAADETINFASLPQSTTHAKINLYRLDAGDYKLVNTVDMGVTSTTDATAADGSGLGATLATSQIDGTGADGTLTGADVFKYKYVLVDNAGYETASSVEQTVTVAGAGGDGNGHAVILDNLPTNSDFTSVRIYRTEDAGSTFYELDTISMAAAANPYVDDGSVTLDTGKELDTTTLNGNYSYLITYSAAGEEESRPSLVIGPQNIINGRIRLEDFPTPPTPGIGDGFPAYDKIRIYRNLSTDTENFYLVDEVSPGDEFVDNKSDAAISDLDVIGNKQLDLDGPKINSNTFLIDVVKRDGLNFENMFQEGELAFTGYKGERSLGDKNFTITDTTIVQDFLDFMENSLGIQPAVNGSANPIPSSLNTIIGETGVLSQGVGIKDGRIRIVSNNGVDNATEVRLSSFQLDDNSGVIQNPNLNFGVIQEAKGQGAVTDFLAYDTLGIPINVRLTATLERRDGSNTVYRWYADSSDNDNAMDTGDIGEAQIAVGTGLIFFDGDGNFVGSDNSTVNVQRRDVPSQSPLEFELDFSLLSGLASESASLNASRQDGSNAGSLTDYIIGEDGVIRGIFSNGVDRDLGQIRLARFGNPGGLEQRGENMYSSGVNSGLPVEGDPGENGIGDVIAGAVELSNTDIGSNLIDLILASTQFRGNSRVITTAQELFDELLNLNR